MTTNQIIQELGLEESSDEFKAQIISKILSTADLRFVRIVDEEMTAEERQELEEFSKDKSSEEIAKWIEGKFDDAKEIYNEIVTSIVADMKSRNV